MNLLCHPIHCLRTSSRAALLSLSPERYMRRHSNVTISLIAPTLPNLLNKILEEKPLVSLIGIQMKSAMKEDSKKRYQDVPIISFLHVASLLDPRFKTFLSSGHKEAAHNNLQHIATEFEEKRLKIKIEKLTQSSGPPLPSLDTGNEVTSAPAVIPKVEAADSSPSSPPTKRRKETSFFNDFLGDLIITKVEKAHLYCRDLRMNIECICLWILYQLKPKFYTSGKCMKSSCL